MDLEFEWQVDENVHEKVNQDDVAGGTGGRGGGDAGVAARVGWDEVVGQILVVGRHCKWIVLISPSSSPQTSRQYCAAT